MNASQGHRLVLAVTAAVASLFGIVPGGGAVAVAADGCSVDTFPVAGTPGVKVTLCPAQQKAGAAATASVALGETIESGNSSFTRNSELDFFDGETTSRSIEDIPLAKLGLTKSLHLTIGYKAGVVHIEHALLVPGAIPLK